MFSFQFVESMKAFATHAFLSNTAVEPRPLGRGYKALMFCSITHWT